MWNIEIEHIGGIHSGEAEINAGANIIQASNFQGKSSFLAAIQTVMGTTSQFGDRHPLMEGEDEGEVTLETEDETYNVNLSRSSGPQGGSIGIEGNPYLTDEKDRVAARLFAFLGEDNPVRAAVREQNMDRLTELLTKPLDMENIEGQKDALRSEIVDLQDEKREAKRAKESIVETQQTVTQTEQKLEELRERKGELEELVDESDDQENLRDDLSKKERTLERKRSNLEKQENTLERQENQLENKKAELEGLEVPEEVNPESGISEKQDRVEELDLRINLLNDLHRSNKAVLDEGEVSLITDVDRSISGDTIDCWVCGEDTTKEAIEDRLNALESKKKSLKEEREELNSEIKELKERKQAARQKRRKKETLEDEIGELELNIQEKEGDIETLEEEVEELKAEVEELREKQAEIEEDEDEYSTELTDVTTEIGRKENKLENNKSELENLEEKAEKLDSLKEQIKEKKEEKAELNRRQEQKYDELTDEFEAAMTDILQTFAPGFDSASLVKKKPDDDTVKFTIRLARDGHTTTIDNLSEGERELLGIITALAGYRTFNVGDRVPCILLDGIGQLAAEHIRNMIEYLEDTSEILVTTAYPEAGEFDGTTISPDNWEVVSDEEPATP